MFAFVYLLANLTFNFSTFEENNWKLSLDKDDIVIYTRSVVSSNFNEFLAEAKMIGSIDLFRSVLLDIEKYPDWMPDCKAVEIIEQVSQDDVTYHMRLKVPFPFANRDVVQQLKLKGSEGILEIDIVNHPRKVKELKNYIRMPQASGKWTVKEISDDMISIRFQYFADPGGDIPAWLVNSFIVKNPHITLLEIKKMLVQ